MSPRSVSDVAVALKNYSPFAEEHSMSDSKAQKADRNPPGKPTMVDTTAHVRTSEIKDLKYLPSHYRQLL
eukprot:scaffold8351_cov93-Skeletonema_dohrnii-CCMP3373.AAC.3